MARAGRHSLSHSVSDQLRRGFGATPTGILGTLTRFGPVTARQQVHLSPAQTLFVRMRAHLPLKVNPGYAFANFEIVPRKRPTHSTLGHLVRILLPHSCQASTASWHRADCRFYSPDLLVPCSLFYHRVVYGVNMHYSMPQCAPRNTSITCRAGC